jgi:ABC-type glutathione transport system ATPase component
MSALLEIEDLRVEFGTPQRPVRAVEGIDLAIDAAEVVGLVGESARALPRRAARSRRLSRSRTRWMAFSGRDLSGVRGRRASRLAGRDIA